MTTITVRKRKRLSDLPDVSTVDIERVRRTGSGHTPRPTLTAKDLNLLIKSSNNNSVGNSIKGN